VLLKGAGYAAIDLAPGRGRRVADIDLLVAKGNLTRVEELLSAHGWQSRDISEYDDAYYRQWMHELPPLHHAERHSTVDLHHAVLPTTSRLKPSSERLLAHAVPIGSAGDRVLSPPHMVLHGAAHLFHDGEIAGALRDLVDLDSLLRTFGAQPRFWDDFVREAQELDLTRPAFYAVRYAQRWFRTPVPAPVSQTIETWGPPAPVRAAMDQLVSRTLPDATRLPSRAAVFSLYVRSHWLRMPPLMLARHLTRKAVVRMFGEER
jgi:hypothetical protein